MTDSSGASQTQSTLTSWRDRCSYWLAESSPTTTRKRRERETRPLVLTGHGLSIRVDKGCLLVRDGNTHYPAEKREWRFFNGALDLPTALVVVDGSGEITLDALDWLAIRGVSIVRLRWDGQFVSVVTAGGQAASVDKVRWQRQTRDDRSARVKFARELILAKAHRTARTMEEYVPRSHTWNIAYENVVARTRQLERRSPRTVRELLGLEGSIANEYFRSWKGLSLKWKVLKQLPIPEDWRGFTSRSALRENFVENRRATHPINAMLNYAYGVLLARTQIRLIADGYDPTIGIMHDRAKYRGAYPAFALDQMEPMRPVVDCAVLQLVASTTFSRADFSIQDDGVCRLNPELARRVAQLATEYGQTTRAATWAVRC